MKADNKYTQMQKDLYNKVAENIGKKNHREHDNNPDLWNILFHGAEDYPGGKALDFGCGGGRNIRNLYNHFADWEMVDGVDISPKIVGRAAVNLNIEIPDRAFNVFANNGVDLSNVADETYDFVFSTIVFQHICVRDIRLNLMREIFRVMRPGGRFNFQMAFDRNPGPKTVPYEANHYDATTTNGNCDAVITDPDQIVSDLKELGFDVEATRIRDAWAPPASRRKLSTSQWIYVLAKKPVVLA